MKVCEICGRHPHRGRQIARRGLAKKKGGVGKKITGITKRTFKPNLQRIRAVVDGKTTRIRVCAACIRAGKIVKPNVKHRPPKPKPVVAVSTAPGTAEAPTEAAAPEGGAAPAPEATEGKAGEPAS
jgi:large subunit ribosomal protein L28